MAPDKEAERALGPKAEELRDCLLLEDRGYEHRRFFLDVQSARAFFIVRGKKAIRPIVRKAHDLRDQRLWHLEGKPLSWEALPLRSVDVAIEYRFDTEKSAIAEGLIRASMLVVVLKRAICFAAQLASVSISPRRERLRAPSTFSTTSCVAC